MGDDVVSDPPSLWLIEITSPLPFKIFMAKQNLWSWYWDTSLPFPQVAGLLNKGKLSFSNQRFPLQYWL